MNIFVTDADPAMAAANLDDKRVVKMVLESAQMLSTAMIYHTNSEYFADNSQENKDKRDAIATLLGIYKPTHPNHPANVWARESKTNYLWLYNHFEALLAEYHSRYPRTHKCSQIADKLLSGASLIPNGPLTPFANCAAHAGMNISYKHVDNVHLAYKLYLNDRWDTDKRTPTWYGVAR